MGFLDINTCKCRWIPWSVWFVVENLCFQTYFIAISGPVIHCYIMAEDRGPEIGEFTSQHDGWFSSRLNVVQLLFFVSSWDFRGCFFLLGSLSVYLLRNLGALMILCLWCHSSVLPSKFIPLTNRISFYTLSTAQQDYDLWNLGVDNTPIRFHEKISLELCGHGGLTSKLTRFLLSRKLAMLRYYIPAWRPTPGI